MAYEFTLLHRVNHGDLKSLLNGDFSENKYKEVLSELHTSTLKYQPNYEIDFPYALNAKRKYFEKLINNESTDFLNELNGLINNSDFDEHKYFLVNNFLLREIEPLCKMVFNKIVENEYSEELLKPMNNVKKFDFGKADMAFIYNLLKHHYVRLYLEVQETYSSFVNGEHLSENELYATLFREFAPTPPVINDAQIIEIKEPTVASIENRSKSEFKRITSDFRSPKKGVLEYEQIIKNPERFASVEEDLFTEGLIDRNLNFIDGYGKKTVLSIICYHLIRKGYFNKKRFRPNREITERDITRFLEYRYNTEFDKMYRLTKDKDEVINQYIDNNYWLSKLTSC